MSSDIKEKTTKGVFWSFIESLSVQLIQFSMGIVVARLLSPEEFGIVGMLAIFIGVAQTFVDSGFANALIRNNKRTELDFSTAFFFNIAVGVIAYFVLFACSPFIANFYDMPILEDLTKVICLNVFINSLGIVPRAKFTIAIDFKRQAKATTTSVFLSGALGIYLAYTGWGVWSLVAQSVSRNFLNVLLLWIMARWMPMLKFSWTSFREMWNYGYKLLLSALLNTVYTNIYTIVIGKAYSATDLGNFTQANKFAALPSSNITGVISRVTFPIMSTIQDDDSKLERVFIKYLRLMAFIIFPLMMGLASLSEPLIHLVLTDKWLDCVPILQILCFSMMWYPFHYLNVNLLQVKGRSDWFLKLEILKKVSTTIILAITIPLGIIPMVIGMVVDSIICLWINTIYSSKLLNLGFLVQIKAVLPTLIVSLIMGTTVYLSTIVLPLDSYLLLLIGTPLGIITYIALAYIFKMQEFNELMILIKSKLKK